MKSKIIFCFFLVFFLAFQSAKAQLIVNNNAYWEGEIMLKDGTLKKGYIQVPNTTKESIINFKTGSLSGTKEKFKRKEIDYIIVTSDKGFSYRFENIAVVWNLEGNKSMGTSLYLIMGQNNYVTFYIETQQYITNSKTGKIDFLYVYNQGQDFPSVTYVMKKRGEEKARLLHTTGIIGGLIRRAKVYLTETPELLKRIEEKELKIPDLPEIIETYIKETKDL